MIDEIFAMIMKEARDRPGKDMIKKTIKVVAEISERIIAAMEGIRAEERREKKDEGCRKIHNGSTSRTDMPGNI